MLLIESTDLALVGGGPSDVEGTKPIMAAEAVAKLP